MENQRAEKWLFPAHASYRLTLQEEWVEKSDFSIAQLPSMPSRNSQYACKERQVKLA
jgi:hypothetical protein